MDINLEQYTDKKVIVTVVDPEDPEGSVELEGKCEAGSEAGMLLKVKGQPSQLLTTEQVLGVALAPEKEKGVTKKHMLPIALGKAKGHLAYVHGIALSELKKFDEEGAFKAHADIDHTDLGHDHAGKSKEEKEAAKAAKVAAAAASETPTE